jgi:uncharacterized protein
MDMLTASLAASAAALGLTGAVHCLAMCATPCTALCKRSPRDWAEFLLARWASYAAAGALAAGIVSGAATWFATSRGIAPLWIFLQGATLLLALWWLATGRPVPALKGAASAASASTGGVPIRWLGRAAPAARPALAGALWAAWPCALLHSALVLAALAPTASGGAVVMTAFAWASAPGVLGWVGLGRLHQALVRRGVAVNEAVWQAAALRMAGGLMLALAALGWAGVAPSPLFCMT